MEESWRWPSVALHTSHPSPTSCSTPRFNFLMMLMDDTKPKNIKLVAANSLFYFGGSVSKNLVSMKWGLADASTLRK